jgi:twitching motility protein PilT
MDLIADWVQKAHVQKASDLHLEAGISPALRISGKLSIQGDPCGGREIVHSIRQRLSEEQWRQFHDRKSLDVSILIAKVRCRVHVFQTARGLSISIRLFRSSTPTIDTLNLHPSIRALTQHSSGLVLICGATGSGKSSTLAGLIEDINRKQACQIITLEQPIEYIIRPKRSLIRQREVGKDTPSFTQGLIDALRQDPDVILVGEMREAETMKRTLDAAETGHLVLSSLHASSCVEAIQRLAASVPEASRDSVLAQLADCLVAVVSQRLVYWPKAKQRVPECSILMSNHAVKNCIRTGNVHRIHSIMETGKSDGMYTESLYREWLSKKISFCQPELASEEEKQAEGLHRSSLPPALKKREPSPTTGGEGILNLDDVDEDPESVLARYRKH